MDDHPQTGWYSPMSNRGAYAWVVTYAILAASVLAGALLLLTWLIRRA